MGSVFLAVTGAETLYADMGHFGRKAIGFSWLTLVYPCLMLNYMGQGALLLSNPAAAENPFFYMAPEWARLPMVVHRHRGDDHRQPGGHFRRLLGHPPGDPARLPAAASHRAHQRQGGRQIYIPAVNWALLVMVVLLVVGFGESTRLAAAYGISVSGTMIITTMMLAVLIFQVWKWNRVLATLTIGLFLAVDGIFFASNITKIADGGWFPLLVAAVIFIVLTTWATGRALMRQRLEEDALPLDVFIKSAASVHRVRGTAVFLSTSADTVPSALLHNLKHNQVLHERVLILNVKVEEVPHVPPPRRLEVHEAGKGFYRVILHYGFMDEVDVPADLVRIEACGERLQHDEHELLPRPPEADRDQGAAGHGAVARAAVRLDDEELRKRDGVLQASDQPRHRARQPAADMSALPCARSPRPPRRRRRSAPTGRRRPMRPAPCPRARCSSKRASRAGA